MGNAMNTRIKVLLSVLGWAVVASVLSGCTAFGTYAGWRADQANAHREVHATRLNCAAIPSGYPIEVLFKDGRKWTGRYAGQVTVPSAVYAARYDSMRQALAATAALPPLNELLLATKKTGQEIHIRFAGFQTEGIAVSAPSISPPWTKLALDGLDTLSDINGSFYSPGTLQNLLAQNRLPLRNALRLRWNGDTVTVPLEDVQEVHAGSLRTSNWAFGMALGVVVDALVAGTIFRSINK